MKTLHKLGVLGLVLALSLSLLAGCSNTSSQSGGAANTPAQSAPQASDDANTPDDSTGTPDDGADAAGDFTTVEAGKLIMSTNAAFPPYEMTDDSGNLIGTQEGTTGYNYCSASPEDGGYGEENVIAYTNGATAVQALLSGKVDCVVIDSMPAEEYVKANPGLKILDTEFTNEDYAIAVKKGNTALLNAINTALNELIEDGTVQSIVDSYIKAD